MVVIASETPALPFQALVFKLLILYVGSDRPLIIAHRGHKIASRPKRLSTE